MSTDSKNLSKINFKKPVMEKIGKKNNLPNYNVKLYAIPVIDMNNTIRLMIVLDKCKM